MGKQIKEMAMERTIDKTFYLTLSKIMSYKININNSSKKIRQDDDMIVL